MTKVYDCVMFFDELDMLELRFNILNDVVDYFVVCEAEETHSGQPKPLNILANWDRFKQWQHKMIYVNAGALSNGLRNSWQRENYHRMCIAEGLMSAERNDWIIVSDVDEIPAPEQVAKLHNLETATEPPYRYPAVKFEIAFYYYDMNHRVEQGWAVGAARFEVERDPNRIRTCSMVNNKPELELIGGWHFSYFGGPQAIIRKHAAFMHHADPVIADLPHDPAYISNVIQSSTDLYGRDLKIVHVPTSDGLPRYVLDNAEVYQQMGWLE